MLEVLPLGELLRRARLKRLAILAGLLAGIGALAMQYTEWPWFAINAAILLVCAAAIALPGIRRILWPGAPWVLWVGLATLTCLFVVHSYYIELLRQRSDRFDVLGVRFPLRPDSTFTIGADDSVDVRLEMPADSLTQWRLKFRKTASGLTILTADGVDGIQQVEPHKTLPGRAFAKLTGGSNKEWAHRFGSALLVGSPPLHVTSKANPLIDYQLEIRTRSGIPFLFWNNDRAALQIPDADDPAAEVHNARLLRRLKIGIRLDELPWTRIVDQDAAHNLVLFVSHIPSASFKLVPGLNEYRFQLVSRSKDWRVGETKQSSTAPELTEEDSIQVSSNGYRWVFGAKIAHLSGFGTGQVDVSFGKGPSPRLGWLPASGTCEPATRCTLISNRRLPPAIPYFDISGFGLDTTRFGFLARVSLRGNSLSIVTPTQAYTAQGDTVLTIPAQARRSGDQASYQMQVYRAAKGGFQSLLLTLVGLALLIGGVSKIPAVRARLGLLLRQNTIAVNAAWAIASISTVLLGIRLALGYRIAYAAPYLPRGADTAIGMILTVIVLTAALVSWAEWAPWLVRHLLKLERTTPRPTGLLRVYPAQARFAMRADARNAIGSRRSRLFGLVSGLVGVCLISSQRFEAVVSSAVIIVLVLMCWTLMEYLGSQQTEASVAISAGEVLDMEEPDRDWGRWTALALVTVGIPLSVLARGVALPLTIVVLVLLFILTAVRIQRRHSDAEAARPRRTGTLSWIPRLPDGRWGALLFVGVFLFVFNLALVRFEGPTLLFIGVFFLFLLAIRLGHHSGRALYGRQITLALAGVTVMFAALLLALPIDFGLMLVLGLPLATAFVITLDLRGKQQWLIGGAVLMGALFLYVFVRPVLYPSTSDLRMNQQASETNEAFYKLGGPLARFAFADVPVRRSIVRALAAQNPNLLELVLSRAGPSPTREQVVPAMEQIWGGRAYAASGLTGEGLARQTAIGRGVPTVVSYAENTFSVYVLAEHGFLGGLVIILCYLFLLGAAVSFVWRVASADPQTPKPNTTAVAVVVGGVLMLTVPALYVAAANIGAVPLTGQNMPFLGLNAWSDVAFVGALLSAIFAVLLDTAVLDRQVS